MEAAVVTASSPLLLSTPRRRSQVSFPSFLLPCKNYCSASSAKQQQLKLNCKERRCNNSSILRCSASGTDTPSVASLERWLLQPAGDGDSRHIGYRVERPSAFEIASNVVTVGRLPEKANIVLPVATVSGAHARLEKKDGSLLVTDLESTNGTYINERRLTPGIATAIEPGSLLIFGDIHLAMFRVLKIDIATETEESSTNEASS